MILAVTALVTIARQIHPFLAINHPVPGEILVVEGWVTHLILRQAISFLIGTHARRTPWLFQNALGNEVTVGVLAVPHPEYDEDKWWAWSSGVPDVIGETITYLYARFLFSARAQETSPGLHE